MTTYAVVDPKGRELAAFTWDDPGPEGDPLYSALRVMCGRIRRRVLRDGVHLATSVSARMPQNIDVFGRRRQ